MIGHNSGANKASQMWEGTLVCLRCGRAMAIADDAARCVACARRYAFAGEIPIAVADCGGATSTLTARQAAYFDQDDDAEWEIERPDCAPVFHRWLLQEKFRRSTRGLPDMARMLTLSICGGSGMDAEFLARAGANVVCADISLGAAKRAAERAHRHGVRIVPVVADAERLPFADRSFDFVYVHDGLHHLERPYAGLSEMVRVTRQAVSITEPADAGLTRLAVRAGVAEEVEDAGNRVARLGLADITAWLEGGGLTVLHAERYAMFYRHHPGWPSRLLSQPLVLPLAKKAMRGGNSLLGRIGNKLAVVAMRT